MQSSNKSFRCSECSENFKYLSTLVYHEKHHVMKKMYLHQCKYCNQKFSFMSILKIHEKQHVLQLSDSTNSLRQTHKGKIHEGRHISGTYPLIKKYVCKICQASYNWFTAFHIHQKQHVIKEESDSNNAVTGTNKGKLKHYKHEESKYTKQYICKFCQTSFNWFASFYIHVKTHERQQKTQNNIACSTQKNTNFRIQNDSFNSNKTRSFNSHAKTEQPKNIEKTERTLSKSSVTLLKKNIDRNYLHGKNNTEISKIQQNSNADSASSNSITKLYVLNEHDEHQTSNTDNPQFEYGSYLEKDFVHDIPDSCFPPKDSNNANGQAVFFTRLITDQALEDINTITEEQSSIQTLESINDVYSSASSAEMSVAQAVTSIDLLESIVNCLIKEDSPSSEKTTNKQGNRTDETSSNYIDTNKTFSLESDNNQKGKSSKHVNTHGTCSFSSSIVNETTSNNDKFSIPLSLDQNICQKSKQKQKLQPDCKDLFLEQNNKKYMSKFQKEIIPILSKSVKDNNNAKKDTEHSQNIFCTNCASLFTDIYSLSRHIKWCINGELCHVCNKCGQGFPSERGLAVHILSHSEYMPFTCYICESTFTSDIFLKEHMKTHTKDKQEKYGNLQNKNTELLQENNIMSENLFCEICNKSFRSKKLLLQHNRIHFKPKFILCDICGYIFHSIPEYKKHIKDHKAPKERLDCFICKKRFAHPQTLRQHIKRHTERPQHKCKFCNKEFFQKTNCLNHLRTHTGERPFKCDICHQTFTQVQALTRHKKSHNGERSYFCSLCDRSFVHCNELRKHHRSHTEERPYKCKLCSVEYRGRSALKRHRLKHHKPDLNLAFQCNDCFKRFENVLGLKGHLKYHSKVLIQHEGGNYSQVRVDSKLM